MKKTILSSLLAIAAVAPFAAQAADGTISFTGSITAQTCTINGGTPNLTVALPAVSTSTLNAAGQTAGRTAFQIQLTACSGSATKARAFFETGPNVNVNGRLNNTAAGGAANVQIALVNPDGTAITAGAASGSQGTQQVAIASNAATLPYAAQYFATGAATAGPVASSIQYSIEYQ